MLAVNRFKTEDAEAFHEGAAPALRAFAACAGYVRGGYGRAVDDPGVWLMWTEWETVGDYRRSLSSYDVKMCTPFLASALPEPVGFEDLMVIEGGSESGRASDHSPEVSGRSDRP
ncbi:antibiotic biosynthesis monooxygenase [Salininema proteolyticum]|uniref:Antibiotic biosynthesis monooxygenase n=1 Tax=Salininema proteolyticum TaxID=1607685 RepID=A0ABV8TSX1_9ACTN